MLPPSSAPKAATAHEHLASAAETARVNASERKKHHELLVQPHYMDNVRIWHSAGEEHEVLHVKLAAQSLATPRVLGP